MNQILQQCLQQIFLFVDFYLCPVFVCFAESINKPVLNNEVQTTWVVCWPAWGTCALLPVQGRQKETLHYSCWLPHNQVSGRLSCCGSQWFSQLATLVVTELPIVLHLHLKDETAERPDWGWRHADSTPFSLLLVSWESRVFGLSRALLFCCYHSIFDFQLKRLLSASYIIPFDESKPQTEEMRTLLVGAHICIPFVSRWGISHQT